MNSAKKILLAEDDAFLINVYANELRKLGAVSVAPDGEIAISRIKIINPDLLILDASLAKIDGFSVLKIIREDLGLKELKIIMLSNYFQEEDTRKIFDFGVIKFFAKAEYTAEEIANEIKKILS